MSYGNFSLGYGYGQLVRKPRVFVSYHHADDQGWYDQFSRLFDNGYDIITDNSLERRVDSDDSDYTRRRIREENITGSSLTIVLCGPSTWGRRWVDWEIQMTLNKEHALLGIGLPKNVFRMVPTRLTDNILSGYAGFRLWTTDPFELKAAIDDALQRAKSLGRICNNRPSLQRSMS